jgi:hypothetical protein
MLLQGALFFVGPVVDKEGYGIWREWERGGWEGKTDGP